MTPRRGFDEAERRAEELPAAEQAEMQKEVENLIVLADMFASGCTTNIADLEFCQIYEPIFADYDHDTQETIGQIDRNNLVYDDLCT